ncbi:hypothetical protein C3J74_27625 [Klebsiella pneumoniae subsp. pneumoniae]|nr:hypothetical protein CBL74_21190 [Klebsiella pneumoniae]PZA34496.1 hypothetical protein C3J79_27615 [Klebsiella pneumoniae subsp. pneumoniae]PZA48230.1 hypothetical protein C3J76_27460 [Klebsiella pneumoniae subsp. pneumoniae]PZA48911.1 hypothetical protein C3J73_27740 [Klebsiella pneumoniae subsp. pneumoniae]PZA62854.1 hypothetical protein C3J87_27730 [Klebsiella pneumoniae subsp. pneumoniae]
MSESLKSNDQKQVNTVVHPPFLPDNSGLSVSQEVLYAVGVVPTRRQPQSGRISALAGRRAAYERVLNN